MPEKQMSILLVDDHQVLRDGLRLLLEAEDGIVVVGEAANGEEALKAVATLKPNLVVLDLGLPDISGIEVTKQLKARQPDLRIVVLSMHTQREFVVNAIEAGADGYVPKSSTHESLLNAIRTVNAGERYLHRLAANALVDTYMDGKDNEAQLYEELTEREREVIRYSAMGFNSREIGEKLIISPKTVDTYRQRAFDKLGIEHRSELVRLAIKLNILDDFDR